MVDLGYNVKLTYKCDTCGVLTETYATVSTPILQTLSCTIQGCKGSRNLFFYVAPHNFVPEEVEFCGKDMVGIWLPDRFGIEVFVPVKCNRKPHDGTCTYTDYKSGYRIEPRYKPTLEVDDRGCVVTKNYILNESDDSVILKLR